MKSGLTWSLLSLWFQAIHRKYNPSSRLVLYGCAAASFEDRCSNNSMAGFGFEWGQVQGGAVKKHN